MVMAANGSFAIVNRTGATLPRSLAARVASPCATSDFRNDGEAEEGAANRFGGRPQGQNLSRFETSEYAPLWYGPRLRPAFVAQLLGQVLYPAPPDAASAAAAYEEGLAREFHRAGFERHI